MELGTVDAVVVAVLLVSMLVGAWRGLVYEVMSVLAWVAAFVLAQWFADAVGAALPLGGASETTRYVLGFLTCFVGTLVLSSLLITLFKKMVTAVGLRPIDRALGGIFGLVRGVLLLMFVLLLVSRTPLQQASGWQEAPTVKLLGALLKTATPMLPADIKRYLPE